MVMKHKHKWMKFDYGSQVCSICGINRSSTGYKYRGRVGIISKKRKTIKILKKILR